jgi:hypothetical protein
MTMKKFLFLILVLISGLLSTAQTGPAGVGTSANNVFWLKANAGTSSTTNNTPISAWNDQSGNGINMTQTVAAQQPSFATNVMNGFPALQFDNVASTNDKMIGPDSPLLDNTNGYSFFTVSRLQNVGDARVIVSKRVNVGVDQSFMLFYYTSSQFNVDIQTNDNRFTSNFSYAINTNYIIDVFYDGTLAAASRSSLYLGETFDRTATETATMVLNNTSPVLLGSTDAGDGRPFGGYISEVIIYREALVPARRIIVNNYLSAKYDIALSANDKYAGDNSGNGHYDFDVAGVGQESTGSNTTFSPSACGGFGINVVGGLDNTDYVMAGHAVATNSVITTDVGGMTGSNNARWLRIWYVDVTNTSTALSANIQFDATDGGTGSAPFGATASDYVLLYRAGQSGNWTEVASASSVTGDKALFNGITLSADGYYTLGSRNVAASVLPIELNGFTATVEESRVDLTWSTLSEKNNAYFSIEKSRDGIGFEEVLQVKGAGNSSTKKNYNGCDLHPYEGLSYYRLKQTDIDLSSTYSPLVAVNFGKTEEAFANIYPNPANGSIYVDLHGGDQQDLFITLRDQTGKACFAKGWPGGQYPSTLSLDVDRMAKGIYLVTIVNGTRSFSQKIILK